jgi:hypothetical protein
LVPLTDNLFLRSQATGVQRFKALVRLGSGAYSVLVFLAEFLETRIIAERIEHWIEPEKRRSERYIRRKRAYVRYREQFLQSRDGAVGFAHFRGHAARISSGMGPSRASFSIGTAAIAFSMNANTAMFERAIGNACGRVCGAERPPVYTNFLLTRDRTQTTD